MLHQGSDIGRAGRVRVRPAATMAAMALLATSRPLAMKECPTCRGTGMARAAPKPRREGGGPLDPATLRAVMGQVEQRLRKGSGAADLKRHLRWLRRMIAG
jgi:hypothetical protein